MVGEAQDAAPPPPTLLGLEARLAVLEQGKPKTWQERTARNGALVALLLSITTGGYTIYDNFWVRPREAKVAKQDADLREVQRGIAEIAAINQSLGSVSPGLDASTRIQIYSAGAARKRSQISLILPLVDRIADRLDTGDLVTLASEVAAIGERDRVLPLSKLAVRRARTPAERLFSASNLAGAEFWLGDPVSGRRHFDEAARAAASYDFAPQRATIYATWAVAEARLGNCAALPGLIASFGSAVASTESIDYRMASVQQFATQLVQVRKCPGSDVAVRAVLAG